MIQKNKEKEEKETQEMMNPKESFTHTWACVLKLEFYYISLLFQHVDTSFIHESD